MAERRLTIITFVDFGAETMRIEPDTPDGRVRFRLDAGATFTLQQRYRYVTRAGQLIELPWQPAGEGVLVAGHPPVEGVGIG